jgi:hypothetical protein
VKASTVGLLFLFSTVTIQCDYEAWERQRKQHKSKFDYNAFARKGAVLLSPFMAAASGLAHGTGNYKASTLCGVTSIALTATACTTKNRYHRMTDTGMIVLNSVCFVVFYILGLLIKHKSKNFLNFDNGGH